MSAVLLRLCRTACNFLQNGDAIFSIFACNFWEFALAKNTWFRDNNGKHSTCCRVLTREFDMGQGEHKEQCIRFTGMCAFKVAEILCRELGILNEDE